MAPELKPEVQRALAALSAVLERGFRARVARRAPGQEDARGGDRRGPGCHQGQRLSVPVRNGSQRVLTPGWPRHTPAFPGARRWERGGHGRWEGATRPLPGRGAPRQTGSTVSHTKGAHVRVQSRPPAHTVDTTIVEMWLRDVASRCGSVALRRARASQFL